MEGEKRARVSISKENAVLSLITGQESSPSRDQGILKVSAWYDKLPDEAAMAWHQSEEKLKSLNEKLSQALLDNTVKDNLVKQHVKVAEEAVAGWEKSETEAIALKMENDNLAQQKLVLEDKVSELDEALKDCMRQLQQVKKEQGKNISEPSKVMNSDHEVKSKLGDEKQLVKGRLELVESENAALKEKISSLSKAMDVLVEENEQSKKSLSVYNRQTAEMVKKNAKLEAECQKLRGQQRKRASGSAALRQEKEAAWSEDGKLRKSFGKVSFPISDFSSENLQREYEILKRHLSTMEEENKSLKDRLLKQDNELQASRATCAKTAAKLCSVEEQLKLLKVRTLEPNTDLLLTVPKSGNASIGASLTSISENGHDDDPESWASALIAELDQFTREKVGGKIERLSDIPKVDLMDDFLEMEKLASLPSPTKDEEKVKKFDGSPVKHYPDLTFEKTRASFEDALMQKEQELEAANQNCSVLSAKLLSLNEALMQKEQELEAANQTFSALSEKLLSLNGVLIQKEQELEAANQTFSALSEKLLSLNEVLIRKEQELEAANQNSSTSSAKLLSLNEALIQKEQELEAANQNCSDSSAKLLSLNEVLLQKEQEIEAASQSCSALSAKLSSLNEAMEELRVQSSWTETALVSLQEKLDAILEAEAKGEDIRRVLDDIRSAMAVLEENFQDSSFCLNPSSRMDSSILISGNGASTLNGELAVAISSVVNFLRYAFQQSKDNKLTDSKMENNLNVKIADFAGLLELALIGKTSALDLIPKLTSILSIFESYFFNGYSIETENRIKDAERKKLTEYGFPDDKISPICKKNSVNFHLICKLNTIQIEKGALESEVKTQVENNFKLEEDLINLRTHNTVLESVLATSDNELKNVQNKLEESNQIVKSLEENLASLEEQKDSAYSKLESLSLLKSDTEYQLKEAEMEVKSLREDLNAVKLQLQNEQMLTQNAQSNCRLLEEQLQRKEERSGYSKQLVLEEEIRNRQEMDIALAASKLAECQETILSLSKQLEALACPADGPLQFSLHEEKGTEKSEDYELDSPLSPNDRNASWEFQSEYYSIKSNKKNVVQGVNVSDLTASDIYKTNQPDSLTADYMDGQFAVLNSDTEESSPTGSASESMYEKNGSSIFHK